VILQKLPLCALAELSGRRNTSEWYRNGNRRKNIELETSVQDVFPSVFILNNEGVQKLSAKPSFLNFVLFFCQLIQRYTTHGSLLARRRREGSGKQAYFGLRSFFFLKIKILCRLYLV